MSRSIKISGDTSELKKSILELSKMVTKDLGKSKIELFTPETKKFIRTEAVSAMDSMKKQIDAIKDSTKKHQQALSDVVKGSREELKIREKILKAQQHITKLEKDRSRTSDMAEQMGKPGFMKQFGKFSGLSTIAKGVRGIAGGGMGFLGGLGGIAGLGGAALAGYGISRMVAGRETYKEGIPTRLGLMGRGVYDQDSYDQNTLGKAGLNALTLRQAQLRDMDVFGKGGATQQSIIQRSMTERNFGLESGTMSGIGAQLRPQLGGQGANQTLMKLQASLIASGITDAIGPYLETAAAMLTELNERGFTMDDSVTSLFNSMLKTGMGEQKVAGLMLGADQGIRGATGEASAFFQDVLRGGKIGGKTIGGTRMAMQMGGLYGTSLEKLGGTVQGVDLELLKSLGIGGKDYMKTVASGTLGRLDKMYGTSESIEKGLQSKDEGVRSGAQANRISRLNVLQKTMGLKGPEQAMQVEKLLKEATTASTERQEEIANDLEGFKNVSPELKNLTKINASTEGIYTILKDREKSFEDALGKKTAPLFNTTNEFLGAIDSNILKLVDFFNGSSTFKSIFGLKTQEERKVEARTAKDKFLKSGLNWGGTNILGDEEVNRLGDEEKLDYLKKLKSESAGGMWKDSPAMEQAKRFGKEFSRLEETSSKQEPIRTEMFPKKAITTLQGILEQTKVTARNSKMRGIIPPGSSNTSGSK